jgi:hypothetical protein
VSSFPVIRTTSPNAAMAARIFFDDGDDAL